MCKFVSIFFSAIVEDREMEEMVSFWDYQERVDGLNQELMYSILEIEKLKEEANEETRNHRAYVNHLIHLLNTTIQERDEARNQLHNLRNNSNIITSSNENSNIVPQFYVENPISINSSTTESNSLSTLSDTYNYPSHVSSPVDSLFDAVSSPDVSNFHVLSANQIAPSVPMIDRASLVIDNLVKGRVLPQNGKFLQAVMEATGKSALVAGQLPQWRNAPRIQPFQIPPAPMKGYDRGAFAQPPVSNVGQFMFNFSKDV